jgi:predicted signal transduction protein with EAL and GGDEF domain
MSGMPMAPSFARDALGWIVVGLGAVATLGTIVAAFYWTIRPGERDPLHPKRMILRDDR